MKNYLEEIECELKKLELLKPERKLKNIDEILSLLIEDSIEHTFYMSEFDKEYFERRVEQLFLPPESIRLKCIEEGEKIEVDMLINGEPFHKYFSIGYDEVQHFFSFLEEINGALKGAFLRVPLKLSDYMFLGIYISDAKKAEELKRLFALFSMVSAENLESELTFTTYPAKPKNSQLEKVNIEKLEEHLSFDTGRNFSLFSPDKKLLMVACADENIYIWNRNSKELEAKLFGHSDHVLSLAVHPRKSLLVSGACMGDGTLKVWDTKTYKLLKTIGTTTPADAPIDKPENRSYYELKFTSDGKYLLAFYTNGDDENMIELFDTQTFNLLYEAPLVGKVKTFSLSSEGNYVALYIEDKKSYNTFIQILKLSSDGLKPFKKFYAKIQYSSQLFFSEDGCYLVESVKNGKIHQVWELEYESFSLAKHYGYVNPKYKTNIVSMALLLEKNLLAIEYKEQIELWDTSSFKKLREIEDEAYSPTKINFSSDGKWIIKHLYDEQTVWSVESGEELLDIDEKSEVCSNISSSTFQKNNLKSLAISSSLSVFLLIQSLYDNQTDTLTSSLIFFNTKEGTLSRLFIEDLEYDSYNSSLLLNDQYFFISQTKGASIWFVATQEELSKEACHKLWSEKFAINFEKIEAFWREKELVEEENEEYLFFSKSIYSHTFDPSAKVLAVGTDNGLDFWDIPSNALLETWEIRDKDNYLKFCSKVVYISSNSLALLIAGELYILSKDTQKIEYIFSNVSSFDFYQEEKILAFSSNDRLTLFSLSTGKVLKQIKVENSLDALTFSPNGELLAGSQLDHYLIVWESKTLKPIHTKSSGQSSYCDNYAELFFTPNGEQLVARQGWKNEVNIRQINSLFSWRKWSITKSFDARAIAFSEKGDRLSMVNDEREYIEILSAKRWRKQRKIPIKWEESAHNALGFSPDGKELLFVDEKGMIHFYDCEDDGKKTTLIAGRKGDWVVIENGVVSDSGSKQVVPKNLMEMNA